MDKIKRLNKINESLKSHKLNEIAMAAVVPAAMTALRVAGAANLASKAVSSISGGNNQAQPEQAEPKKKGILSTITSITTPGKMVASAPSIIPTNENFLQSLNPFNKLTDPSDTKTDTTLKVAGHAATAMSVVPGLNLAGAATDASVAGIRAARAAKATSPEQKEYESKEAAISGLGAAAGVIPAGKLTVAAGKVASGAGKSAVRAGIPAATVRSGIKAAEPSVMRGIQIGTTPSLVKPFARNLLGGEEIQEARKPGEPLITPPPPQPTDMVVRDRNAPPPPPPPPPPRQKNPYEQAKEYIGSQWKETGGSYGIYSKLKGFVKAGLKHVEQSPILRKLGIAPFPSEAQATETLKQTGQNVKQAGKVAGSVAGSVTKDVASLSVRLAKRYPNVTKGLGVTVATGNPLKGLVTYLGSKYLDKKGATQIGKDMAERMADWIRTKTGVKMTPPPPPPPKPTVPKPKDTGEIIDVEPIPPEGLPDDRPTAPKGRRKDSPDQQSFDWFKPKG